MTALDLSGAQAIAKKVERNFTIRCKSNAGFEDQLTSGKTYQGTDVGDNSILITNDLQQERWYGLMHFSIKG